MIKGYYWFSFYQFLLVQFFLGLSHYFALEILDSEFYSTELDDIKLLYFVVLFIVLVNGLRNSYIFAFRTLE